MKKLSTYLFLILFSFQTPSWADDIRDFQIEGMSIGDSALDYFSEEEIKKNKVNYYNSEEFVPVYIEDSSKFNNYNGVQFHYKKNDKNFKIFALSGIIWFKNNINDCHRKMKEIDKELTDLFTNAERDNRGTQSHGADKSGKSKIKQIIFTFKSGDDTAITCTDWTKKMKYPDNLRISLAKKELITWIKTEAYK